MWSPAWLKFFRSPCAFKTMPVQPLPARDRTGMCRSCSARDRGSRHGTAGALAETCRGRPAQFCEPGAAEVEGQNAGENHSTGSETEKEIAANRAFRTQIWLLFRHHIKGHRQADRSGIAAVRQPLWFAVIDRVLQPLRQQPQRFGHVAPGNL